MELIGLILAVPAALIGGIFLVFIFSRVNTKFPKFNKAVTIYFLITILLAVTEIVLLIVIGPVKAFIQFGQFFTALHLYNVLFLPLTFSGFVVTRTTQISTKRWMLHIVGVLICMIGYPVTFLANIVLDESIVGVDAPKSFYQYSNIEIINMNRTAKICRSDPLAYYDSPDQKNQVVHGIWACSGLDVNNSSFENWIDLNGKEIARFDSRLQGIKIEWINNNELTITLPKVATIQTEDTNNNSSIKISIIKAD